jgi:lipid-A-disaccharide synthase
VKPTGSPRILLSAGEPSGDNFGAQVARELRRLRAGIALDGCGGRAMAAEGVRIRWEASGMAVLGFGSAILALPAHWLRYREMVRAARVGRYDAAVLIDYPGFHLRLGSALRAMGVPVIQLVAPQLWAWGAGRLGRLERAADAVGVVLPFEEDWFASRGLRVTYLGHPVTDRQYPDRGQARRSLGLEMDGKVLGIFPGSRTAEIGAHWPIMRDIASRLLDEGACSTAVVAGVSGGKYREAGRFRIVWDRPGEVLRASTAAIIKSGTATLEAAYAGTPHVIIYRAGRLTYEVARRRMTVPWIGLANLIAGAAIVPEFWHLPIRPEAVADALRPLLEEGGNAPGRQRTGFDAVRARLGLPGVAARAADLVLGVSGC